MTTTAPTAVPELLLSREAGVMTVTLNRPTKLNALTVELLDELHRALCEARDDHTVRAVVLTGAGRGFSAGADLNVSVASPDRDVRRVLADHYAPVITLMRELEKPIVGAINGVAAGAGMSLALATDLRVASDRASFIQAFVKIGLVPDAGSTWFLPRLIGHARALELAMLGDRVEAESALAIGLVNRVVPHAELPGAAAELATRLAAGPRSIGLIKRAMQLALTSDLATQLRHEEDLQGLAVASSDSREGVTAFIEKRPARFTGR